MKTKKPEPGSKEFLDQVKNKFNILNGHLFWFESGLPVFFTTAVVNGRKYPTEKIAWLLHTGEWPACDIGFKNGINTDFRMPNLFEVLTDKQVTITKSGDLFVVSNGTEQVMTTENLDDAVQMVRSILEG